MQLIENWQDTKEALLEGLSGSKKSVVGTLMENQMKYLAETAAGRHEGPARPARGRAGRAASASGCASRR